MIRWIPYTFVRTVCFFIGGIVLALAAPDLVAEQHLIVVAWTLTLAYFLFVFFGRPLHRSLNPGWLALPLIFVMGYIQLIRHTESREPGHLLHVRDTVSHYKVVISRFPEEKARTWRVEASLLQVHTNGWHEASGRVFLYLSKEDFPDPYRYGDVLLVKGRPRIPDGAANPGEFDYREFLALKNIYHQHFLRKGDVLFIGHDPPSSLLKFAFRGRAWAEATLEKFVRGEREQAVASALVLGVTDGLDDDLLAAYAATGSMHILAVSGLHVSILYFILLRILSPLNSVRGGRWTVAVVSLSLMWLYAFVTGLSPSVLRAVVMFSFLVFAAPWRRSTNIYNTLAVSAFCLLIFNPFLIRSVGFQLSYLAVLGIVFLYPKIVLLWEPRHRIATEVWKISAVSIAAQVATFPLGLLYFHQFPNYFLLSNLLVVPLSFVVLIGGLIVLAGSFLSSVAMAMGFCLELVIRLLNTIVFTLEKFPFSLTENIFITAWQCVLLMAFIAAIIVLLQYRKFQFVVVATFIAAGYATLQWIHYASAIHVQQIAVYRVPGHTAVDLIDRGQTFFLSDTDLAEDAKRVRYHVHPNRLRTGVMTIRTDLPFSQPLRGGKVLRWNGKTIVYVNEPGFELPPSLAVDWLIIGNNAMGGVENVLENVTCKKIVLDSSNSFLFASRFLEEAKLYKLDVHSVLHQGAFIAKIEKLDT